jgi:hypothetical protein
MRWREKNKSAKVVRGFVVEYPPHNTFLSGTRKSTATGATGLYKPEIQYGPQ